MLLPLAMDLGRRVFGHITGGLDTAMGRDYQLALGIFKRMSQLPQVFFFSNSHYIAEKVDYVTGVRLPVMRMPAFHIRAIFQPTMDAVLIWKYSSECCDNRGTLDALLEHVSSSIAGELSQRSLAFNHLRDLRAVGKSDYADLLSHRAAVFFPYDVVLAAVQELHFKNMPLFLPEPELGLLYVFRDPGLTGRLTRRGKGSFLFEGSDLQRSWRELS